VILLIVSLGSDTRDQRIRIVVELQKGAVCTDNVGVESYAGKWVTGFEKAAYRGG